MFRFLKESKQHQLNSEGFVPCRSNLIPCTEAGEDAICAYLKDKTPVSEEIKRMARIDPVFLPAAAHTSRELGIHFLTTAKGNIQCGYHAFRNKGSYDRDGWGKPGAKVHGVPGRRIINHGTAKAKGKGRGKAAREKTPPLVTPRAGLANCGCCIDDCLLEFFLSKHLTIKGKVKGEKIKEGMFGVHDFQPPRVRSFMHAAFWSFTGPLKLDELFYNGRPSANYSLDMNKLLAQHYVTDFNATVKACNMDDAEHLFLVSSARMKALQEYERSLSDVDQMELGQ